MAESTWFDDVPVIGQMGPEQAASKLREVGETELADAVDEAARMARAIWGCSARAGISGRFCARLRRPGSTPRMPSATWRPRRRAARWCRSSMREHRAGHDAQGCAHQPRAPAAAGRGLPRRRNDATSSSTSTRRTRSPTARKICISTRAIGCKRAGARKSLAIRSSSG